MLEDLRQTVKQLGLHISSIMSSVPAEQVSAINDMMTSIVAQCDNAAIFASAAALRNALMTNQIEALQLLIDRGADINQIPPDALEVSIKQGNTDIVLMLLPKLNRAQLNTVLGEGASYGHYEIVKQALLRGAKAYEALYEAAKKGHVGIVELLLAHGANDSRALTISANKGHLEIVKLLLTNGHDAYRSSISGTPLVEAVTQGHTEIVRLLLEAGAVAGPWIKDINKPFCMAARHGNIEILELLISHGANVRTSQALCQACLGCQIQAVEFLLDNGADIHLKGDSALLCSVQRSCVEVFRILLRRGANITAIESRVIELDPARLSAEMKRVWLHYGRAPSYRNLTYQPNDNTATCVTCYGNQQMCLTNCGHHICYWCVIRWFESSLTCPLCRTPIVRLMRLEA
jgi:ankyrin repeat protein